MKQFLLSFCLSVFAYGALQAQSLTITPNPKVIVRENVDLSVSNDLEEHVSVRNNTADSIHLKWLRVIPEACPEGWKTLICDNVQCYAAIASTNYDPIVNPALDVPFSLAPGATYDNFLIHIKPASSAGCCKVNILFSTIENPDEILETLVYDISVNDPQCLLSSTNEPTELAAVQVYPNPSTGQFSITDNPLVKSIAVHNLLGKSVQNFAHQNGQAHDLGNVPDGLYLVSLLDENGQVLKSVRMTKQGLRP